MIQLEEIVLSKWLRFALSLLILLIVCCSKCATGFSKEISKKMQSKSVYHNDCGDQLITSENSLNGSFSSPNYPHSYPGNVHCTYHLSGKGQERVQILFSSFDLYKRDEQSKDCETADTVMVFITINGQKERIDNFCGNKLPPQLMSNGVSMSVEFKSFHSPDNINVRGFEATYRFLTNFGITQGKQDQQAVCVFNFNSTERGNGTIISPNYPGLYPRDTECNYYFYGNTSERVHITFSYFDVEGVTPCTQETASDYIEFSNYRTVDRKIPRHCGLKVPRVIESDGDFFRVTFKSNDRFDGTGFEAFYQFRSIEESFTVKKVRSSNCANIWSHLWQLTCVILIIINININILKVGFFLE